MGKTFIDVGKWGDASLVRYLADGEAVKEACKLQPETDTSSLSGWIDGSNGWADAATGLKIVGEEARKLGVKFADGPRAAMKELLRNEKSEVVGVRAQDGTQWRADKVVLAAGAWTESLIDCEGQLLVSSVDKA